MKKLLKLTLALSIIFLLLPKFGVRVDEPEIVMVKYSGLSFSEFFKSLGKDDEEDDEEEVVSITITRFYPSDSTGSDTCMATMCLSNKEIKVNENGWYTYKGKVIIAAATNACLERCKNRDKYGEFPKDYRIYDYYDEIIFSIEGKRYTGIILDSCGACMWHINGEENQRYDIFTVDGTINSSLSDKKNIGKISAELIIQSNKD